MSPVTPTPGLVPAQPSAPKGPAELSTGPDAAKTTAGSFVPGGDRATTVPSLNPGKPIPGPEDWRALERRASSFRV